MLKTIKNNNVLIGVSFALLQTIMASLVGLFAKLASEIHHPTEVMFYRSFFCLIIAFAYLYFTKNAHKIKTANLKNQIVRGTVGSMGMILTFWAFATMPLSELQSLLFAAPIFVVALSYPVLGEKVGKYRIIATLTGFCGVLLVIQPGVISSATAAILGLSAAFFHAAIMLILRWLGKTEDPMITVFYFALISTCIMLPVMPFTFTMPTLYSFGLLLLVGFSVFGLQVALTKSYVYADAAVIAPIGYTTLLWMIILDMSIWGFFPKTMTLVGAAVIMISNFVIIYREAVLKKAEISKVIYPK